MTHAKKERQEERITLCIAEPYYMLGKFRVEEFDSRAKMEMFRGQLDKGTTTWIKGEEEPKRRVRQ